MKGKSADIDEAIVEISHSGGLWNIKTAVLENLVFLERSTQI